MKHRWHRKKISYSKIFLVCFILFLISLYIIFESQIKPGFIDLTRLKAEELCTNAVNTAVLEVLDENDFIYSDFADVTTNDKSIINISTNSINTNKFKSLVALKSQEEIGNMSGMDINYRLGDFFGTNLLNGRGPEILIKIYLSSSVTADIESKFDSCGINQTKHTLNIIVTSKVYVTSDETKVTRYILVFSHKISPNLLLRKLGEYWLWK